MGNSQEIVKNSFNRSIIEFGFVNHSLIASEMVNHFPRKNVAKSKHEGE